MSDVRNEFVEDLLERSGFLRDQELKPKLTLFSVPKPFEGHIGTIQRNAIESWIQLRPSCEIILLGGERGTAQVAAEFGVEHVPDIQRDLSGTPLVSSLFEIAERMAISGTLCYANCDIILMSDFLRAVERVGQEKQRFMMAGRRWDVDVRERVDFRLDWEQRLRSHVAQHGKLCWHGAIDYFVFPRGLCGDIPAFVVGRAWWDHWLLYRARSTGAPLIDATQVVMAVHQNHDYSHHPEGEQGVLRGAEARHNLELAGGRHHVYTLLDATHLLTPTGLKLTLGREYIRRRLVTLPMLRSYEYVRPRWISFSELRPRSVPVRAAKALFAFYRTLSIQH